MSPDKMEGILSEQKKLADEKRLLDAKLSFEKQRANNVGFVDDALEKLPQVISVLPPAQRRELVGLLIHGVVVKPFEGETAGIFDGSLSIAPQVGTKRFFVKISIYEKAYYQWLSPIRSMVRPWVIMAARAGIEPATK